MYITPILSPKNYIIKADKFLLNIFWNASNEKGTIRPADGRSVYTRVRSMPSKAQNQITSYSLQKIWDGYDQLCSKFALQR